MAAEAKSKPSVAELAKEHGLEPYLNDKMIVEMADGKTVQLPVEAILTMESNVCVDETIIRNGNEFKISIQPKITHSFGLQIVCTIKLPKTVPFDVFKYYRFHSDPGPKYESAYFTGIPLHGDTIHNRLNRGIPYRSHAALLSDAKRAINEVCKLYGWES
jgi:hypothetical protein